MCRAVRSYEQLDESPLCIVIARRATTLSDISCRSEPYKKDDNDEEAVLVRDGIYFVHESLRFFS